MECKVFRLRKGLTHHMIKWTILTVVAWICKGILLLGIVPNKSIYLQKIALENTREKNI